MEFTCEFCGKTFETNASYKSHRFQCSKNPNCINTNNEKFRATVRAQHQWKRDAYENNPKYCKCCNAKIPYDKRVNNFCSNSCSARMSNWYRKIKGLPNEEELREKGPPPKKIKKKRDIKPYTPTYCVTCGALITRKTKAKLKTCGNPACLKERLSKAGRERKNKRRSKGEIYLSELISQQFSETLLNKNIFGAWDADIIINDRKVAILYNGPFHYVKIGNKFDASLPATKNRDFLKIREIIKSGYIPYIVSDLGKFNREFVNREFIKIIKFINILDSLDIDKVLDIISYLNEMRYFTNEPGRMDLHFYELFLNST